MNLNVENLYPKVFDVQTYNPNPRWNETWASVKDQLKVNKSYKFDLNNVTKEDIKVQFKKFEEAGMKPIHLLIDEMVMKRLQEEKEKNMKNTIEYIKATLRTIANSNRVQVIVEDDGCRAVKAAFYDSARFEKTQVYILFVNDLEKDWELVLDGKIRDAFGKDVGRGGFTYIDTDMAFKKYCEADVAMTKHMLNSKYGAKGEHKPTYVPRIPKIKDVRFNGPATIIFWADDTKTVVKAHDEDVDYEKGLAMAIAKKALGNKGNYFNEFKKWLPEEEEVTEITLELEGGILEDLTKNIKEAFCPQNMEFKFKVKEKNNEKNNKK